ncbi:MAG: outer membrane beta-barrel protein [Acidobacteria bacterium]|nr:outer membrane beta-barrel protein [Acidobacteriota bacterium]
MRRWLTCSTLVVGACLMLSTAAEAQLVQDFQLNFFAAGSAYTRNDFEIGFPQTITPVPGTLSFNESIRGGIRVNVYTRGHWGQEFFYSYEPNQMKLTRRTTPESTLQLDMQVHNLGANALYYLKESEEARVRPFLSIGLGAMVYRFTPEAKQIARDPFRGNLRDLDGSRELALNYGTGVSAQMSRRFGVRIDLRGFLSRSPSFGLARQSGDPNATVLPATGAIHNLEVSTGIVFFFQR